MKFIKTETTVTVLFSGHFDNEVAQVTDPELYEALDPIFRRILATPDMPEVMKENLEKLVHEQCLRAGLL